MIDRARIFQSNKKNKDRNSNEMPEEQHTNPKDNQQELRSRKRNLTKKTSVEKLKKMNKNENNDTSEMHKNMHNNNNNDNQNENNEKIIPRFAVLDNYYKDKKGTKKRNKKVSIASNNPPPSQNQNMEQNEISNKHTFNDKDHKPYTNFVANLKTHMRESSMEKDRENPNNEDNNNPKIKGNKKNIFNFDKFVNKDIPNYPKSSKNVNRFLENEENYDNSCNNTNREMNNSNNIEIQRLRKELELKDNKINELLKTIEAQKNQIIQSNNNYGSLYEENKKLRLEINNLKSMINQNQQNQCQNIQPQNIQSQNNQNNDNKNNHILNIIKNKISDTKINKNEDKPQNENENNIIINKEKTSQNITNIATINKNNVNNIEIKRDKNLNNLVPITNFKPVINTPISNNNNPSVNNIVPVSNPIDPPQNKPEEKKDRKRARASQAFERFKRANRNLITTAMKADKSDKISDIAKMLETHMEGRPRRENSVDICERIDEGIERIFGNENKNGAYNNEIVNIIDNQPVVHKKKKKVRSFSYDA